MTFRLIYIFIILVFVGCRQPEQEVIDLNKIIAQSENYKEEDNSKKNIVKTITFTPSLDTTLLSKYAITIQNPIQTDTLLFPERFKIISKEVFQIKKNSEITLFAQYEFKSKEYASSVFQNWINCFGGNCKSIPYGTTSKISSDPFLLLLNNQQVVYIYNCSKTEQEKWIQYFITTDSEGKIIQQITTSKSSWSTIKEGEIQPIEINSKESL